VSATVKLACCEKGRLCPVFAWGNTSKLPKIPEKILLFCADFQQNLSILLIV